MDDPAPRVPPPYVEHQRAAAERLAQAIDAAEPMRSDLPGAPEPVAAAIAAAVERRSADLIDLSRDIHAHPELCYEEHWSAQRVANLLSEHGHDCEVGAYGLDTALRATAGSGSPRVAVLAEYDALPGIGHGCGHNVICATAVGAFLALAEVIEDIGGAVELIGCPAEEGGGGKELIARAGGFDTIDAALMLHPFGADAAVHPWLGVRTVDVTYHGLAAHAAVAPHLGRNALDAVVSAYNGFAQLRQHMLPDDRVHGIITDGGQKPNIVPERAAASFYLRSTSVDGLAELTTRADAIFRAAALSTGTEVEITWDVCPVYLPVRNNTALAGRYAENLRRRGRKVLPAGVLPAEMTGSTDLGNVSLRIPAIHPLLGIAPIEVSLHTAEFARWAISDRADAAIVDGAIGLALTAADFLLYDEVRSTAREEFEREGGVLVPDIPPGS